MISGSLIFSLSLILISVLPLMTSDEYWLSNWHITVYCAALMVWFNREQRLTSSMNLCRAILTFRSRASASLRLMTPWNQGSGSSWAFWSSADRIAQSTVSDDIESSKSSENKNNLPITNTQFTIQNKATTFTGLIPFWDWEQRTNEEYEHSELTKGY
jgi:hypothetical protein